MVCRNLTPRELDALEALAAGAHTYGALARRLEVQPRTAQELVYSIAEKLPPSTSPPLIRAILYAYRTFPGGGPELPAQS